LFRVLARRWHAVITAAAKEASIGSAQQTPIAGPQTRRHLSSFATRARAAHWGGLQVPVAPLPSHCVVSTSLPCAGSRCPTAGGVRPSSPRAPHFGRPLHRHQARRVYRAHPEQGTSPNPPYCRAPLVSHYACHVRMVSTARQFCLYFCSGNAS